MKLLIATIPLSLTSAASLLEDGMAFAKSQISNNTASPHARNFGHAVNDQGNNIFALSYGCWCLFADNAGYVGSGYGEAVDEMDAECKLLHDNYNCLVVEESVCDPYNVVYNRPGGAWTTEWADRLWNDASLTSDDIVSECNDANRPLCERSACIIESTFLWKYYALANRWASGEISLFQNSHYHVMGFSQNSVCNVGNGYSAWSSSRGSKRCCGEYQTYKKIYFTGTKGCCNGNVYNHQSKKCCPSGNIRDMADDC